MSSEIYKMVVLICPTFARGRDHIATHFDVIEHSGNSGTNNKLLVREKHKPLTEPFFIRMIVEGHYLRGMRPDAVIACDYDISAEALEIAELHMAQKYKTPLRGRAYYQERTRNRRNQEFSLLGKNFIKNQMDTLQTTAHIMGRKATIAILDDIEEILDVSYDVTNKRRAPVLPKSIGTRRGK